MTNWCNLKCKYCYANIKNRKLKVLLDEQIRKILDILSSLYEFILIEFHGGEPLLYWEKIKDIVLMYHKRKNFYFGIQTNATLLTQEIINFIKKYFIRIGISIDGPQKIHDRNRCYLNGKGSFQDVIKGIYLLQQNKIPFTTISVIEKPNECREIFEFFINNQIEKIKLNSLSSQEIEINKYQKEFAIEHLKIAKKIIEHNKISPYKIICGNIAVMTRSLIGYNKYMCLKSPCGAGSSMVMIDEEGNIYPCEEMYGRKEFILTTIENINNKKDFEKVLKYSPVILTLKTRRIENIVRCKTCTLQRFCGGGCTAHSFSMFNSFQREDVMCQYKEIMFKGLLYILQQNKDNIILLTKPEKYNLN